MTGKRGSRRERGRGREGGKVQQVNKGGVSMIKTGGQKLNNDPKKKKNIKMYLGPLSFVVIVVAAEKGDWPPLLVMVATSYVYTDCGRRL